MTERPLLLLPSARIVEQPKGKGRNIPTAHIPSFKEQKDRLTPLFKSMQQSFISTEAVGTEPETVLVIETVGSIDNFHRAVNAITGLEWLGETDSDDIEPDDFFYDEKEKDKPLVGRLFLTMSNQRAIDELLSLWDSWKSPKKKFKYGYNKWKEIFSRIKTIRRWDTEDRLRDTGILHFWQEELKIKQSTSSTIKFEIELWYRIREDKRKAIKANLEELIKKENGLLVNTCLIPEIRFHALKVEMPVSGINQVIKLVTTSEYPDLFRCNDVMFFRPGGQCKVEIIDESNKQVKEGRKSSVSGNAVVGIFDGYPFVHHILLRDRIILDDPDNILDNYQSHEMKHGTAMASLICHGELDTNEDALPSPVYFRPIMIPNPNDSNAPRIEYIPENEFLEDIIERSTKRIFEGESDQEPVAPTLKVINLSIGDRFRLFDRRLSSWARLLDWLSVKYQVLFCVSAGNHHKNISLSVKSSEFVSLPDVEKVRYTIKALAQDTRQRRMLCLAESINSLTIGATHNDSSLIQSPNGRVDLLPNCDLPSPISAHGYGFRRAIKPDIFFDGGRQLYDRVPISESEYTVSISPQAPGHLVATTSSSPIEMNNTTYCRGTSNSAALATRAAAQIFLVIDGIRQNDPDETIQDENISVLIKTLLVHSASWGNTYSVFEDILKDDSNARGFKRLASRYLGYGRANILRVLECTKQRATAIGCGSIEKGEVHEFYYPLPISLSGSNENRKLTITLAWFSPINLAHRNYRKSSLSFNPPKDELLIDRSEAQWQQVKRGTVQHEVLTGKSITDYEDGTNVKIPIICRSDAGDLDEPVHYGLAVTLEVAEEIDIPIYEEVKERIRIKVPIKQRT